MKKDSQVVTRVLRMPRAWATRAIRADTLAWPCDLAPVTHPNVGQSATSLTTLNPRPELTAPLSGAPIP